jgi:transcriptional regulator with XRE-family HTH domain
MPSFDTGAFMAALSQAAARRHKTMKEVAAETGVSETTLSRMSRGQRVCDAASMAALSAWAGINPARFSGWVPQRRDGDLEARARNTKLRATQTEEPR